MTTTSFLTTFDFQIGPEDWAPETVCVECTGHIFSNNYGVPMSEFTDCEIKDITISLPCGEDVTEKIQSQDQEWFQDLWSVCEEKLIEHYAQQGE
jgi:hypothetical protein